ncbi:MAG: 30S ribosomal protein S17 [Patescibacteria group bacterium]|nr:30S ribosomal protein S17 [Patescibacteria group bacterium]
MPKRLAVGVVTSDRCAKTRRVEISRREKDPLYGKYIRRRTVCHVHDEENSSAMGDTVEIRECPPRSKLKRWELVRVVEKSRLIDLVAMRAAQKRRKHEEGLEAEGASADGAVETPGENTPGDNA